MARRCGSAFLPVLRAIMSRDSFACGTAESRRAVFDARAAGQRSHDSECKSHSPVCYHFLTPIRLEESSTPFSKNV